MKTYTKLVLGIGASVRNRLKALPVGKGIESVNVEGEIVIDGDKIQFAMQGIDPFVTMIMKVNDNPADTYYGDQLIVPSKDA